MEDTIRAGLKEIQSREPEVVEEEVSIEEPVKEDKHRDEAGKYAKKEPVEEIKEEAPTRKPPSSWKKEALEKWGTLDPTVQDEIERREADFHKGIESYKSKAQFADALDAEFRPYEALLRSMGMDRPTAVRNYLDTLYRLHSGTPEQKQQLIQAINQQFGGAQVQQQAVDPYLNSLHTELNQVKGYLSSFQQQQNQQVEAQANTEIQRFGSDVKNKHFEAVRSDMAQLLQVGLAQDLTDAYEQAIYRNPVTRVQVIAEQQSDTEKQRVADAKSKAEAAKRVVNSNVTSKDVAPTSPPKGSMEDTIRSNARRMGLIS